MPSGYFTRYINGGYLAVLGVSQAALEDDVAVGRELRNDDDGRGQDLGAEELDVTQVAAQPSGQEHEADGERSGNDIDQEEV